MNHQKSFFLITFTKENKSRPSKSSVDEKKKLTWQSGESRVTNENVTNKPLVKRLGCS
ncbi:hypothetical protein AT3G02390 [Arabidopsis thaliana]|uniref:Uncharacterized protein n=1 Tax=Arabidopsis thaliana TaxID=3702 RepID=F4J8E0_ARATH|nr:uncharacterized protein AT3G02390 [Arabidopsis thaliana]AEE73801.1 hypothetical protein AT3G02390 [Arabidopsis thaliana]|eukprot:NP_186888.2 hypothetical protein AT3G02390 [Arabidopsis thaliana]